ncbi:hypothetical protein RHSIM_Rhsim03G0033600 [Rhododendron simsii]|uniref:Uncharacterized protein n=1 Tax=Rhododendron simsii TaxID=118357 RepID=A0A834LWD2_RHOSS|nr:hypothetical protein RHSIM_Rhsim03G0033500 [Rhododendron simsii]KAF7149353.1 hypothetical protein RHSIM_Rhsim03G0033600 [Rhododendron simsii]
MLFLDYLSELELSGDSLSIGFANITGYCVISGLDMGMEPICGQAYGAKQRILLRPSAAKPMVDSQHILAGVAVCSLSMGFSSKDPFKAQEKSGWFLQSLVQICPSYAAVLARMHWVHGVAIDV